MPTPIQMPALSPTMTEGKITKWLKKEGDKIAAGDAIAEVETDKSNLEVEAYDDGYLLKVLLKEGDSAPVGAPIAYIGEKGEKVSAEAPAPEPRPPSAPPPSEVKRAPASPVAAAPPPPSEVKRAPAPPVAKVGPVPGGQVVPLRRVEVAEGDGRLRASPLAKKMAHDQGLDLSALQGSGPQGRIIKRDIEAAISQGATVRKAAPIAMPQLQLERRSPETLPLSSMRRVIAQRLTEVKPGVPHFYLTVDIEMGEALKIRDEANALETKVSVNDIVVKAAAIALRRVPRVNVSLQGEHMVQYYTADVGIAVAIDEGLITPVIRDADVKGLSALATEARDLAARARKRSLKPEEYTGGSITVSNLGMFGIDWFVAVINPPQAAIVAVGAVTERPVVRDGQVVARPMMSATLSGDHRIIDGARGAQYLRELKALLEHPMRLLF
jgi:pyruvate dehydrogenase E2 component (dihydrolipoamide acetyltransferase)